MNDCCCTYPAIQSVSIPGVEGPANPNGTPGQPAYTTVIGPQVSAPVSRGSSQTINVANSQWMAIGQSIFIAGSGYWTITAIPTTTSVTAIYANTGANTMMAQPIALGSAVAASGNATSALPAVSQYVLAGSTALGTTANTQVLAAQITIVTTGVYLIFASLRLDYAAATFATSRVASAKLRCTTNTIADIANTIANVPTGTPTTLTGLLARIALPVVSYSALAGDVIQLCSSLSVAADAGAVNAVESSILAVQLF